MFNFQLSNRPNENISIPIENPILDQFDLINDFENFNEKIESLHIRSHENNFLPLNPDNLDNLDTIYEEESEKKTLKSSFESSEMKTTFSNIPLKEENSLSQISELYIKFHIFFNKIYQFYFLSRKKGIYHRGC